MNDEFRFDLSFLKDNWRTVALLCALFPLVSAALTLAIVPETPIWLRDRGRLDEALQVLKKFRGVPNLSLIHI